MSGFQAGRTTRPQRLLELGGAGAVRGQSHALTCCPSSRNASVTDLLTGRTHRPARNDELSPSDWAHAATATSSRKR